MAVRGLPNAAVSLGPPPPLPGGEVAAGRAGAEDGGVPGRRGGVAYHFPFMART